MAHFPRVAYINQYPILPYVYTDGAIPSNQPWTTNCAVESSLICMSVGISNCVGRWALVMYSTTVWLVGNVLGAVPAQSCPYPTLFKGGSVSSGGMPCRLHNSANTESFFGIIHYYFQSSARPLVAPNRVVAKATTAAMAPTPLRCTAFCFPGIIYQQLQH